MSAIRTGPRPLTDDERDAWTMYVEKTPIDDITTRTGLSAAQIAAAVDLARLHAASLTAAPAVTTPAPAAAAPRRRILPPPRAALALQPPTPWRPDHVVGTGELADRVTAGPPSPETPGAPVAPKRGWRPAQSTPRDRDEEIRVARAVIEVLHTHLAQYEAELAKLLDDRYFGNTLAPATQGPAPIDPAVELSPTPDLAASDDVRAWAIADGWAVPPPGVRLPGAIVRAYITAHPETGSDR